MIGRGSGNLFSVSRAVVLDGLAEVVVTLHREMTGDEVNLATKLYGLLAVFLLHKVFRGFFGVLKITVDL